VPGPLNLLAVGGVVVGTWSGDDGEDRAMATTDRVDSTDGPSHAGALSGGPGVRARMVHAAAELLLGIGALDKGDKRAAAAHRREARDAIAVVRA
jgi:hypothetical protein